MANLKPILFNTEMVRAILDGCKTTTRRIVKAGDHAILRGGQFLGAIDGPKIGAELDNHGVVVAPYQPGDILYVRETWDFLPCITCQIKDEDCLLQDQRSTMETADGVTDGCFLYRADDNDPMCWGGLRWRPSIHMPKGAARIFLRVKDVRVERLQKEFFEPICPILEVQAEGIDIGDHCRECIDAYGEPCCVDTIDEDGSDLYGGECGMLDDPRDEFARLWDSTIKPADRARYGWEANPWVWVIEFERVEKTELCGPRLKTTGKKQRRARNG